MQAHTAFRSLTPRSPWVRKAPWCAFPQTFALVLQHLACSSLLELTWLQAPSIQATHIPVGPLHIVGASPHSHNSIQIKTTPFTAIESLSGFFRRGRGMKLQNQRTINDWIPAFPLPSWSIDSLSGANHTRASNHIYQYDVCFQIRS